MGRLFYEKEINFLKIEYIIYYNPRFNILILSLISNLKTLKININLIKTLRKIIKVIVEERESYHLATYN